MTKPNAPERRVDDPAEEAIAAVLRAEREAHQAVERSQVEAGQLAENARSSARSVADRTERRVRAVVGAFERELADRLAEIDAEAARIATPHELTATELGALDRAVSVLARELTGARP
jgi:vacuolar-type H+-ATPase subunit H